MSDEKKPRVVAIRAKDAVNLGAGGERTSLSVDAEWVRQSGLNLEFEHTSGMLVAVKWTTRGPKGPMRNKCLVSCSQITFESVPT